MLLPVKSCFYLSYIGLSFTFKLCPCVANIYSNISGILFSSCVINASLSSFSTVAFTYFIYVLASDNNCAKHLYVIIIAITLGTVSCKNSIVIAIGDPDSGVDICFIRLYILSSKSRICLFHIPVRPSARKGCLDTNEASLDDKPN